MRLSYDEETGAIYVYWREGERVARSETLGHLADRFDLRERRPSLEALERLFRSAEPA